MKLIQSKDNPLFKQIKAIITSSAQRKKNEQIVLEGIHLAQAWLETQDEAERDNFSDSVLCITTELGLAHPEVAAITHKFPVRCIVLLSENLYAQLSTLSHTTPLLLVVSQPISEIPEIIQEDCVILDAIQDAGNVGSILRTSAAAGVRIILCTIGTASVWSPKVLRAGMGAQFALKIKEQQTIEQIQSQIKVPVFATSLSRAKNLYDMSLLAPHAWVFGNEGAGVNEAFLRQAESVTIPQPGGQESLNVAAAAAVCLYEAIRQRSKERQI